MDVTAPTDLMKGTLEKFGGFTAQNIVGGIGNVAIEGDAKAAKQRLEGRATP